MTDLVDRRRDGNRDFLAAERRDGFDAAGAGASGNAFVQVLRRRNSVCTAPRSSSSDLIVSAADHRCVFGEAAARADVLV